MAETKIEWADYTFNPWRGCTKVSPACENCYAETMSKRNPATLGVWGKHGTRAIAAESYWKGPVKWNKEAAAEGVRKRVFCASLADVFEGEDTCPPDAWQSIQQARGRLYQLIADTPHLDWLLLTKRPENVMRLLDPEVDWDSSVLAPNVWIGTTVENQKYADIRIPQLLKIPAKVRFLSIEPMLGPVDLTSIRFLNDRGNMEDWNAIDQLIMPNGLDDPTLVGVDDPIIDWVIVGGESGSNARPMHPDWVRSIRDQCNDAGVPFLFKQWGNWVSVESQADFLEQNGAVSVADLLNARKHDWSDWDYSLNVGKKKAGRLLDGREWNELPEVEA